LVAGRSVRVVGYAKSTSAAADGVKVAITTSDRRLKETRVESNRNASGSADWRRREVGISPGLDITSAYIELEFSTPGTAWFDSLEVEIDSGSL